MSQLTIIAKLKAKKDSIEAVKTELLKLIAPTRKENGCIAYNLHQDNEDPTVFIFYETWESEASLGRHMKSVHFKSYVKAAASMIEDKILHKMTRIDNCEP